MTDPFDRDAVLATASAIAPHVRRTPVVDVEAGVFGPAPVTLKLELLQVTGTFKPRGAFAHLLAADVPAAGVVGASGGNFGLALAHAARELGHHATIFVPATSPPEKIAGLRRLGADVRVVDGYYADALAASERHVEATGALRAHAYDLPGNVLGAGTLAAELEDQVGDIDTVLVAVGGGGLIGGVAAWFRDRVRIVGVETTTTPTLHDALAAGEPVDVEVSGVAASSLGARRVGSLCWSLREHLDAAVLVTDDEVVSAQQALWQSTRLVAEPGGAAAVAALLAGRHVPEPGEVTVAIVCGANTDPGSVAPGH